MEGSDLEGLALYYAVPQPELQHINGLLNAQLSLDLFLWHMCKESALYEVCFFWTTQPTSSSIYESAFWEVVYPSHPEYVCVTSRCLAESALKERPRLLACSPFTNSACCCSCLTGYRTCKSPEFTLGVKLCSPKRTRCRLWNSKKGCVQCPLMESR